MDDNAAVLSNALAWCQQGRGVALATVSVNARDRA